MRNKEVIQELGKWGIGTILALGWIYILYLAIVGDANQQQFLQDHMARQTDALEKLVKIYAGE